MKGRHQHDEGASLLEVAIVLPLLLTLAIGLAEIGFLVIDYVTVTNAARSGARTGASASTIPTADDEILAVVEEDLCNLHYGEAVMVQIFKADPGDGSMPDPESSGLVNSYVPDSDLDCNDPDHVFVCAPAPLDCSWPNTPGARDNVPPGFDAVGVRVEFSHDWVTGFLPFSTDNWSEIAIMQLEPETSF